MKQFNNDNDFKTYIKNKALVEKGSGSEGIFYYSRTDKIGYKIFFENPNYIPEKVILDEDVGIESFIFPQELITINNTLKAYTTRIVKNNIFSEECLYNINLHDLNFEALKKAYKVLKIDVAKLTNKGIAIFDLSNNLVYNGENLYAIDTCSYYKCNDKKLLQYNIECLDEAIDMLLGTIFLYTEVDIPSRDMLNLSTLKYFDYVIKEVNKIKRKKLVY